jgi:hypothetical protein
MYFVLRCEDFPPAVQQKVKVSEQMADALFSRMCLFTSDLPHRKALLKSWQPGILVATDCISRAVWLAGFNPKLKSRRIVRGVDKDIAPYLDMTAAFGLCPTLG